MVEGLPREVIAASIHRERVRCGYSLTELARLANVAKSTLSQLEAGAGNPSLETMWALATALGVPLSQLIAPPRASVDVIRAGSGPSVQATDADYLATLLAACPPGARRDLFRIAAEPGQPHLAAPHAAGTVEHVYIAAGRVRLGPVGAEETLEAGDFITYTGTEPHTFEALDSPAHALLVSEQR
ncbi:helix-turn-helix domain-containing protein [Ruania rhizosphaerae]|uniref:helix-turn-helix domain-containing protein n=1 Tax=Ruania rhizosphaerae TaxID=1840413 RepID=UPI0013569A1F|nr:helix-turn-helix domain-containing protein [Ruania rhizosphaerae]